MTHEPTAEVAGTTPADPQLRVLVDFRSALRGRTGAGVYLHDLVRAYTQRHRDTVTLFSSSWKDRVAADVSGRLGVQVVDRRVPVRALNFAWHRWGWPPVERLAGRADVAHSGHPLLMPAAHAAQVVTIHDLYFLDHPEHTSREIRRDYPALVRAHAHRADAVVTSSRYGKDLVTRTLEVPSERVHIVRPGAPEHDGVRPTLGEHILFVGTLEPRKNLGLVLDAYERLSARAGAVPPLVIAGAAGAGAEAWLARLGRPPLDGRVHYRGYVTDDERRRLLRGARLLVLPSWDEGFGLPALEAMAAGVPVVASNRGALPEVVDAAGVILDAADVDGWALAMARLAADDAWARALGDGGRARARTFQWNQAADALRVAYTAAIARRRRRP